MGNKQPTGFLIVVLCAWLGGVVLAACASASAVPGQTGQEAAPTASMAQVESNPLMAYPGPEWTVVAHLTPEVHSPMPPTPTKYPGYPAPPTPTMAPPPAPHPTPRPEDPWNLSVWLEPQPQPDPIAYEAEQALLIVLGEVVEILPARWTTPDGKRPANPHTSSSNDVTDFFIYTPVRVQIAQNLKGAEAFQEVWLYVPGGQVGLDSAEYFPEGLYHYAKDEKVLLFLSQPRHTLNGLPLFDPVERYTITKDGEAVHVYGTIPLDEVLMQIQAVIE